MLKKRLLSISLFLLMSVCSSFAWADSIPAPDNNTQSNKPNIVSQQIDILKKRLLQSQNQLHILQTQQEILFHNLTPDQISKDILNQTAFDIVLTKSNLMSVNIELAESQQALNSIAKNIQELRNQINVLNIFGLKNARKGTLDYTRLRTEMGYQKNLLSLEKTRANYLVQLQKIMNKILQFYSAQYAHIDSLLKSQTVLQLKEQQAKSELSLQQQQTAWLKRLDILNHQLSNFKNIKENAGAYNQLENEIFFVSEHINFTYLQLLIARYEEQIQQLKISVSHSNSITVLNKATDKVQALSKQLNRVKNLINERIDILNKRKLLFLANNTSNATTNNDFNDLLSQYQATQKKTAQLEQDLIIFRNSLDQILKQELSSRQGLPGLGSKRWVDLGAETLLTPTLTFQIIKSLSHNILRGFYHLTISMWLLLVTAEIFWIIFCVALNHFLKRILRETPDHTLGHINLKWLALKLMQRNLIDIAVIGNAIGLFLFLNISWQNFSLIIYLSLVWLFFKMIMTAARVTLVETVDNHAGHDVRLYHQLRWVAIAGGIITALTVLMHQLPIIYEVRDLFDRVFLLFLLIVSVFLLKQWKIVPSLILPHIEERRTYLKRVVKLLGLLIPLVLLFNSLIGLFGFVNLILTISWYESIFILVLVSYLIIRGLLSDAMDRISKILIRHVANGWLWMEAFLKPLDKILRVVLFLIAWAILFLLYGWDQQSPVVERLSKLLHYRVIDILNTTITPMNIIELSIVISFLYWAVKWTREFVYRLLLSRTKDLGLRNSIAILSQYAMIIIGLFICLRLLGIDLKALTFVATAFAFGVGLGLRDLVNNFACGFLLLIERPLRVGDAVNIGNYEGQVTHIGSRAVTICTWDHMDVIVPNAEIFSKSFTNWTGKDNIVRSVISIKIHLDDNPQKVQEIIYQVLRNHRDVLSEPTPEVFLKELSEGMMEFEVRYFINYHLVKSRASVRSEVLVILWEAFEKYGIKPAYPHHEICVISAENNQNKPLK